MVSLTLKCCSSKLCFHRLVKYVINLNCVVIQLIVCQNIPISCSTKFQRQKFNIHHYKTFICLQMAMGQFKKKSKHLKVKKTQLMCVFDQLYQLMVFETPFDHFF